VLKKAPIFVNKILHKTGLTNLSKISIFYSMSTILLNSDFKDPIELIKFAKDYWQIREELAYMYKLKRKTNDDKEQLDLDKTIDVLRMMLRNHYSWSLINTDKIRNAIEVERKHRYEGHKNKFRPYGYCGWDQHEPHR